MRSSWSRREGVPGALGDHRLRALFLFGAYTGLRASELRGLRWYDIDLDAGTYQVRRGLHRITKAAERVVGDTGLIASSPKTEESGNRLPLAGPVISLLVEHAARQRQERQTTREARHDDGYIFTTTIGTPLEPSNLNKTRQDILAQAGVSYRTPDGLSRGLHELRRTFATRLRDRGVPLEDVQRLGRWSSPQVLLKLYAATDQERLRAAADEAADPLGGE